MKVEAIVAALQLAQAVVSEWSKATGKKDITDEDFEELRLEPPEEVLKKLRKRR